MSSDLQGTLETTRCPEIIKILAIGKRGGRLFMASGADSGSIYFKDGRIVHAKCGNIEGVKAVYEMALWTTGTYRFYLDDVPDMTTINSSTEDILNETENRIRQMEKIASLIPSSSAVFILDPDMKEKEIVLKAVQWKMLSLVNGERSVSQIAQALGITESDAMKVFYTLFRQGLIKDSEKKDNAQHHLSGLPDTPFISSLSESLTRAIGPVSPLVILETAEETGVDLLDEDVTQRAILIETLHSKVPDEMLALAFLDAMTEWLKTGENDQ